MQQALSFTFEPPALTAAQLALPHREQLLQLITCRQVDQAVELLLGLGCDVAADRIALVKNPLWRSRARKKALDIIQNDLWFNRLMLQGSINAGRSLARRRALATLNEPRPHWGYSNKHNLRIRGSADLFALHYSGEPGAHDAVALMRLTAAPKNRKGSVGARLDFLLMVL